MSDKCPEWSSQEVWSILQAIANDPYECTWYQDGGKNKKASKEEVVAKQQEEVALLRKLLTDPEMERVWKRLRRHPMLELHFYFAVYRLYCEVIHTDTKNEKDKASFINDRLREIESIENWFVRLGLDVDPLVISRSEVARQLKRHGRELVSPCPMKYDLSNCFAEMKKRIEGLEHRPVLVATNAGYQHKNYFIKGLWQALKEEEVFEKPPYTLIARATSVVFGEHVSDSLVRYHLTP